MSDQQSNPITPTPPTPPTPPPGLQQLRDFIKAAVDGGDHQLLYRINAVINAHIIGGNSNGSVSNGTEKVVKRRGGRGAPSPLAMAVRSYLETEKQLLWTVDQILEGLSGVPAVPRDVTIAKDKIRTLLVKDSRKFARQGKDQFYLRARHKELAKKS